MRFMLIRKADADTEAMKMPSTELLGAMGKYMQEMGEAGILLGGDGLKPTKFGKRVKFTNGKASVIDGPFAEAKELIAGFTMIQVKSMEEALEWTKRWPMVDGEANTEIEIRPLFEAEDFGDEFTPEQREAEEALREKIGDPGAKSKR